MTYAHNMAFPLTLLTTWLLASHIGWRERAGLFIGWGIMIFALLFTLTRGVWLAYVIVLGVLAVLKGGRTALAVCVGIVLLGGALLVSSPGVRERAAYMFDLDTNLPRSQIWQANLDMIQERPLLGWGYGNYKRFRDSFYQRYPKADTTAHAHNNFLQMWVDGGLLGLSAFLFLFWSILKQGWRAYQQLPPEAEPLRTLALGERSVFFAFCLAG